MGSQPASQAGKAAKVPAPQDPTLYRQRHRIENAFGRLKDRRRVATRYDRCPIVFLSASTLAALVMFWLGALSLNDNNQGPSPRITSTAVMHFQSEQSVSFSAHAVAEELGIRREGVLPRFNEVERRILKNLYAFIRDRRDRYWVHWNMRNPTYGLEHLEHRYIVLGGDDAAVIPVERRLNFNDILRVKYGTDFAPHQRLPSLIEMNGGQPKHFLTGPEEVDAFQRQEFMRMHMSTQSKVTFMHSVICKMIAGKLKTASRGWGIFVDHPFEGRVAKSLAFSMGVAGGLVALYQAYLWVLVGP